jgi:hypothetical protein
MPRLNVEIPDIEMERLNKYCEMTKRSKTDVIREFIRSLPVSGVLNPPQQA